MEENYVDYKMFGLNKKQSIFGAIFMLFLHAFTTTYSIYSKVDFKTYSNMSSSQINDLYDWYIYYPTLFLAFFFLGRYSDYLFRNQKHNRIAGFLFSLILGWLVLVFFRIVFLVLFYWPQV